MPAGVAMIYEEAAAPVAIWVIESGETAGVGPAHVLAGRLECTFRRMKDTSIPEKETSRPNLILTSGLGGSLTGLSLRKRLDVPVVHCASRNAVTLAASHLFDGVVLSSLQPFESSRPNVMPVLGPLSIVSPALYERAARLWQERLDHLPRLRVSVRIDSGWNVSPSEAQAAGQRLEMTMAAVGGSLLIAIGEGVRTEVADAFLASVASCFHLVWRHGEPDDDPSLGFTACADAVLLYGAHVSTLVEVTACPLPIFFGQIPGRLGACNRFARSLLQRDMVRVFDADFSPWPREVLDEGGRIAVLLRNRFRLLQQAE